VITGVSASFALPTLMGEKSWYMPRRLDRLLSGLTIAAPHERRGAPRGSGAERPTKRPAKQVGRVDQPTGGGASRLRRPIPLPSDEDDQRIARCPPFCGMRGGRTLQNERG
jgi:hypothetical protein